MKTKITKTDIYYIKMILSGFSDAIDDLKNLPPFEKSKNMERFDFGNVIRYTDNTGGLSIRLIIKKGNFNHEN